MASLAGCSAFDSGPDPTTEPPTTPPPETGERTATPTDTATETQTPALESEFGTVLDAVDDLGCDPSGDAACDSALAGAVEDDVAIRFPAGTYRFERGRRFEAFDRLGFVGVGDVSFVPPDGFNDKLLSFLGGWVRFDGIDVNVSAADTTAGLRFITRSGFRVEDVEFRGRGYHPDSSIVNALALAVRDASAQGTVRNVVARHGSAIGHYKDGNGRVGIWVGGQHQGRISIENCHLEEFGNNGIYASRCDGTVAVVGGVYRNNNVCGVRLGGGGNVVRDVTVEVDLGTYTGPYTLTHNQYDTRAIVIEQGPYDKSGQVLIEDCDLRMVNADRSQGVVVVWPTGNGPRIERTRITTEVDWVPGIRGIPPQSTVADAERGIDLVETTIAGSGSWGSAIELVERPGSTIEGTTIEQRGERRDGLRLVDSNPCTLTSTSITTTAYPIFAFNPRGTADGCLVYLSDDTQLKRTGPDLDSVQSTEIDATNAGQDDTDGSATAPDHRCIGEAILAELDAASGAGITDVEERTVSWRHYSSIEAPSDR